MYVPEVRPGGWTLIDEQTPNTTEDTEPSPPRVVAYVFRTIFAFLGYQASPGCVPNVPGGWTLGVHGGTQSPSRPPLIARGEERVGWGTQKQVVKGDDDGYIVVIVIVIVVVVGLSEELELTELLSTMALPYPRLN